MSLKWRKSEGTKMPLCCLLIYGEEFKKKRQVAKSSMLNASLHIHGAYSLLTTSIQHCESRQTNTKTKYRFSM